MAEEFVSQGQVNGTTPAEVVVNYIKVQTVGAQPKFVFDGFLNGMQPTMTVQRGSTYYFDQTDSTNTSNTLGLFTANNGTGAYITGFTTNNNIHQWVVAADAPATLYYSEAGITSALQGGTISCVDAPVAWGADTGKSYTVTIDCATNNVLDIDGTISPEGLGTALAASVAITDNAGYGRIEKGNMRWGAILEVLGERQNPNYVTWPGIGTGNTRASATGNSGNFDSVRFIVNYPTNFTPTTYLDVSGAISSTLMDSPDTAIQRVIAKILTSVITQNRSLGSDDLNHSLADQKVRSSVTAPAMIATYSDAVIAVVIT
jgi:hypothetical protein